MILKPRFWVSKVAEKRRAVPLQFGAADLPLDVADVSKPRDFGLDEVEAMGEQIAVVRVKAAEKLVDRAVEAGILLNEPRPREEADRTGSINEWPLRPSSGFSWERLRICGLMVARLSRHGHATTCACASISPCTRSGTRTALPSYRTNRRVRGTDAESRRRFQRFPFSTAECSMYTTAWCGLDDVRWCHGAIA